MYQQILNFISANLFDVIFTVLFVAVVIFLYVTGYNKKILNRLVLQLVVEAEKYLGSGTGNLKFNKVMTELYQKLPIIVKLFISQKYLTDLIDTNASELQKFLDGGGDISDYQVKFTIINDKENNE